MTVHLVASCTDRKRAAVREDMRLRTVAAGSDLDVRARDWLRRVEETPAQTKAARELYGGEHWQLVLALERALLDARRDLDLWVASAGYGLISADAQVKPYSATFAARQLDSIAPSPTATALQDWWRALNGPGAPGRSLAQLAADAEGVVVIASSKYVRAMLPDLQAARAALPSPEALVVFSGADLPELGDAVVRVDARVQVALRAEGSERLRGTKQGLAARTALTLLPKTSSWPPRASVLGAAYAELVRDVEPPKDENRVRHRDEAVIEFIRRELAENPKSGWTKLLRKWRKSGQACEQRRFRSLFHDVRAELSP